MTRNSSSPRGLGTLLVAEAVSLSGNRISLLAVPWFVLQTTGSAAQAGLSAFAHFLPLALSAFFSGALVDRLGFQRTSVVSDLASALTVAAIPILYGADMLPFWLLLILVLLGTALDAPGTTARRSLLPEVAAQSGVSLERATSAHEFVIRGSTLLGAPVAGVLIVSMGAVNALVVDAATFLASAALIGLTLHPPMAQFTSGDDHARRSYLAELREGLLFVRNDPLLPSILIIFIGANMLDNALFAVLLPAYGVRILEDSLALGLSIGAFGAGALVGAALYGALSDRLPRRRTLILALVLAGAPKFLVLASYPSRIVLVATMCLSGLAAGSVNPLLGAIEYTRIPPSIRGRVLGLMGGAVMAAVPLGVLVAGVAVEVTNLSSTLLVAAAFYLAISALPMIQPAWASLDGEPSGVNS